MTAQDIVELIGGIGGFIAVIVYAFEKWAKSKAAERDDSLKLIHAQQDRIDQITKRMGDLEKKSELQDSEIEELQTTNLELQNGVSRLKVENESLKGEVVVLRRDNAVLKKTNDELRNEIAELKEENQVLRDRLDVVEKGEVKPG